MTAFIKNNFTTARKSVTSRFSLITYSAENRPLTETIRWPLKLKSKQMNLLERKLAKVLQSPVSNNKSSIVRNMIQVLRQAIELTKESQCLTINSREMLENVSQKLSAKLNGSVAKIKGNLVVFVMQSLSLTWLRPQPTRPRVTTKN